MFTYHIDNGKSGNQKRNWKVQNSSPYPTTRDSCGSVKEKSNELVFGFRHVIQFPMWIFNSTPNISHLKTEKLKSTISIACIMHQLIALITSNSTVIYVFCIPQKKAFFFARWKLTQTKGMRIMRQLKPPPNESHRLRCSLKKDEKSLIPFPNMALWVFYINKVGLRRNRDWLYNSNTQEDKQGAGNVELEERIRLRLEVNFRVHFIKTHCVRIDLVRDAILMATFSGTPLSMYKNCNSIRLH